MEFSLYACVTFMLWVNPFFIRYSQTEKTVNAILANSIPIHFGSATTYKPPNPNIPIHFGSATTYKSHNPNSLISLMEYRWLSTSWFTCRHGNFFLHEPSTLHHLQYQRVRLAGSKSAPLWQSCLSVFVFPGIHFCHWVLCLSTFPASLTRTVSSCWYAFLPQNEFQ